MEGDREGDRRPRATHEDAEESQDVEMSAADLAATDEAEQAYNESMAVDGVNGHGPSDATSRAGSVAGAPPPKPPKRRMVITHDKFMTLQSLIVLHLSQVERETGRGVDRDELVDWYLESKEAEIQDVEELEYEKELITKMLKKLVKDNYLIEVKGDVQESLPSIDESSGQPSFDTQDSNVRVYYMVHPSVDTDQSSSVA